MLKLKFISRIRNFHNNVKQPTSLACIPKLLLINAIHDVIINANTIITAHLYLPSNYCAKLQFWSFRDDISETKL